MNYIEIRQWANSLKSSHQVNATVLTSDLLDLLNRVITAEDDYRKADRRATKEAETAEALLHTYQMVTRERDAALAALDEEGK